MRRQVISLLALAAILVGCAGPTPLARIPQQLERAASQLRSYRIDFSFEWDSGLRYEGTQYYEAPSRLRTDVRQDGQLICSFFSDGQSLLLQLASHNLAEEIALTDTNSFFSEPLLLTLWLEAASGALKEAPDGQALANFTWQAAEGIFSSQLFLDSRKLHPRALRIYDAAGKKVLEFSFSKVEVNLQLADDLFSP